MVALDPEYLEEYTFPLSSVEQQNSSLMSYLLPDLRNPPTVQLRFPPFLRDSSPFAFN